MNFSTLVKYIDKSHDGAEDYSLGTVDRLDVRILSNEHRKRGEADIDNVCENVKTSIQEEGRLDNCSLNNERVQLRLKSSSLHSLEEIASFSSLSKGFFP